MKRNHSRNQRVADQLQRELMELLRFEVKDPRLGMVTITGIDVAQDLSHATVYVTHLGGAARGEEVVEALAHAAGHLRSALSRRLRLFSVPQLRFRYDDSIEAGSRMSHLIDEAVAADKKLGG